MSLCCHLRSCWVSSLCSSGLLRCPFISLGDTFCFGGFDGFGSSLGLKIRVFHGLLILLPLCISVAEFLLDLGCPLLFLGRDVPVPFPPCAGYRLHSVHTNAKLCNG